VGKSSAKAVESRLVVLLVHLLKWRFQPERRGSGWRGSIVEQRRRIDRLLRQEPSLAVVPEALLDKSYAAARSLAARETGLPRLTFPPSCPFRVEDVLRPDYLPEPDED
jgi:hypothetical protein